MTILIFANGIIDSYQWIGPFFDTADVVIAADGGCRHLFALQRAPDLVIGDLDSLPEPIDGWLQRQRVARRAFAAEKDETDLELALLYALEQASQPVLIFGAGGGRLDQMLANMLLLAHPRYVARDIRIVERGQQMWAFASQTVVTGTAGDRVSLLPVGGDAVVATSSGLKWELADSVLRFGEARGVSNVMTAAQATIGLRDGILICAHLKNGDDFGGNSV